MKRAVLASVLLLAFNLGALPAQANADLTITNSGVAPQVVPSRGVNVPFLSFTITPHKNRLLKEILVQRTGLSSHEDVRSIIAEVDGQRSARTNLSTNDTARIQFARGVDLYAQQPVKVVILATLDAISGRTVGFDLLEVITESAASTEAFIQRRSFRRSVFDDRNKTKTKVGSAATAAKPENALPEGLTVPQRLAWLRERKQLVSALHNQSERRKTQARQQGQQLLRNRRSGVVPKAFKVNSSNTLRGKSRSLDDSIAVRELRQSIISTHTLDTGFDLTVGDWQKVIEFDLTNTENAAARVNNLYFKNDTGERLKWFFDGFELRNGKGTPITYSADITEDQLRLHFPRGYRLQVTNSGPHSLWAIPKRNANAADVSLEVTGSD